MKQNLHVEFFKSWLVGNKDVLKWGGGTTPPPEVCLGEKRRKCTKKNGWRGRWWYLLTCFSGVTFFWEGLIYFQGGWLRNFQGGHMLETPPPLN